MSVSTNELVMQMESMLKERCPAWFDSVENPQEGGVIESFRYPLQEKDLLLETFINERSDNEKIHIVKIEIEDEYIQLRYVKRKA